ncbi:MAG: DUF1570 domain-containing protein [Phycisphaerae bacterium]
MDTRVPHKIVLSLLILAGMLCALPAAAQTILPEAIQLTDMERRHVGHIRRTVNAPFRTLTTEHFLIVYATDDYWADRTGQLLERFYDDFYHSFRRAGFRLNRPPHRLVWVGFSMHDQFDAYGFQADKADISWLDGYYSARTNRVAVVRESDPVLPEHLDARVQEVAMNLQPSVSGDSSDEITRLTHEAAHQLAFNSGLQTRGVLYPLWLSEGLATNLEANPDGEFGIDSANPARARQILRLHAAGELMPLTDFVQLSRLPRSHNASDLYAQAWSLMNYLFHHHPDQLRSYMARLSELPVGHRPKAVLLREFEAEFGPIEQLEAQWKTHLDSAEPQTL